MFRAPESICEHPRLRDDHDDGERRYQFETNKDQKIAMETETYQATMKSTDGDFVRNRSHDTQITENSSGLYSLDLLREIYPSFSESESDCGGSKEIDNNRDTTIHTNYSKESIKTNTHDAEVTDKNLCLSSLVYNKYATSSNQPKLVSNWVEDKPFDEESLRAMSEKMSERGYCIENCYSKDFAHVEEYVLPPTSGRDILIGISPCDSKSYDIVKKASENSTGTVPMVYSLPRDHGHEYKSGTRSSSSSKIFDKDENKPQGVSRKFCLIACLIIAILLASAVLIGVTMSSNRINENSLENQATAASSDQIDVSITQEVEGSTTNSTVQSTKPNVQFIEQPSSRPSLDSSITPPKNEEERPIKPTREPTTDSVQTTPSATAPSRRPSNYARTPSPTDSPTGSPWGILINYVDPIPENFFPLGKCVGDCDQDADCAEGLVCFQRGPNDPIPFCYGGENDYTRTDYCTHPMYDNDRFTVTSTQPPAEQTEANECSSTVSVVQDCYFWTENVMVVNFENCKPEDEDWIGVYPDETTFSEGSYAKEWVSDDFIDWAFTCGDTRCGDSPTTNRFAFPTNYNAAYNGLSLRVYLLRNTRGGPPYETIAKSESFVPTRICQ